MIVTQKWFIVISVQNKGSESMSPVETKRTVAVKVADTLNNIEGVPVTAYAKELSAKWAKGEITGAQMKVALLAKHRKVS